MKVFLLLIMVLTLRYGTAFSQCPTPGLKIQSAACEDPKNLQVVTVTCSELKVKWAGNKNQQYIVKANGNDQTENNAYEAKVSAVACDNNGSCSATISVKDNSTVTWTVQTVCSIEGASLYSAEIPGENTYIVNCLKTEDINATSAVHVFPNPANDYLTVQYDGKAQGSTEFKIYDITGKKMIIRTGGGSVSTNQYRLDVRKLPPGTYLLESVNGSSVNQTKFILLRN